jgi:hypothetical protein
MPKTKFTFTHADGRVSTRTSARTYTHVVVGRVNLVAERAAVEKDDRWGSSWDYSAEQTLIEVGQPMSPGKPHLMDKRLSDEHRDFLAENPDRAAYIAKCKQKQLDDLAERYGEGDKSPELVLQWSGSATNAEKGAAQARKYWVDVAVRGVDA